MNVYRRVAPLIIILLLIVLLVSVVTIQPKTPSAAQSRLTSSALTYRGVSYVSYTPNGYNSDISKSSLNALRSTGANYVALIVFWHLDTHTSNTVHPDPNATPTDAAVIAAINDIHARGMSVMLKLHLIYGENKISAEPTDAAAWFASYATMCNHYAQIAQDNGVELFCVGNELSGLDTSNYSLWSTLISGVRAIYSGPLTYAAPWWSDEYRQVPFWGLLDYVGINAYFPLSTAKTPLVADLVTGWSSYNVGTVHNWTQEIETLQTTVNKPVIFTEIGYRSIDYAAKSPANDYVEPYNGLGQANCYEAALRVFANKPWFAGIFWWGWSPENVGGAGNTYYTPQNKPAQSVLTAHWLPKFELIPSAPA
ncbi:MAG: glycoside hydrolase family 113 [Halobacteriota archaeon]